MSKTEASAEPFEEQEFLTLAEYARTRGVNAQTVRNRAKKNQVVRDDRGINCAQTDALTGWERLPEAEEVALETVDAAGSGELIPSYNVSLKRKEHWLAKTREIDFKRAAGEVCNVEETRLKLFSVGRELRDALERMPNRVCHAVAQESDAVKVATMLEAGIAEALEDMANRLKAAAEELGPGGE